MAVGLPENVFLTKLDAAANWARSNSLWPMPFATACCGIELMATAASRHDLSQLELPLRSHGGISEQRVPLVVNRRIEGLDPLRRWRNFDAFELVLNHAQ